MVFAVLTPGLVTQLADAAGDVPAVAAYLCDTAEACGHKCDGHSAAATAIAAAVASRYESGPAAAAPPLAHECVPLGVLRALASHNGQSLRAFLSGVASTTPATTGGEGDATEAWANVVNPLSLAIAPTSLPPNPHRAAMRARVKAISKAVTDAEYNALVPTPARVAVNASRHLDPKQRIATGSVGGGVAGEDAGKGETFSTFSRDLSIGVDMRLMSAAGAVVGYYLCYARGFGRDVCYMGAAVGAVLMLLMDAVLLIVRLARDDGHAAAKPRRAPIPDEVVEKMTKAADDAAAAKVAAPLPLAAPAKLTQRRAAKNKKAA